MTKKTHHKRMNDPHAAREASRYDTPIPSREVVLSTMGEQGAPVSVEQLYMLLGINDDEREIFKRHGA